MTVEQVVTISISVLTALGGAVAIILWLSSWLGKVWAARILEKDRLRYGRELEAVKAELGRATQEYLVKFSALHIERAQIIRDLYKKLLASQRQMNSILKPPQLVEETPLPNKVKDFVGTFNAFYQYHLESRIYFPPSLCSQIDDLAFTLRNLHMDITTYPIDTQHIDYRMSPELLKERTEFWVNARKTFNTKADELVSRIETEFRSLLGVK